MKDGVYLLSKKQKNVIDCAIYDLYEGSKCACTERLRKQMLRTVDELKQAFGLAVESQSVPEKTEGAGLK